LPQLRASEATHTRSEGIGRQSSITIETAQRVPFPRNSSLETAAAPVASAAPSGIGVL